MTGKSKSGFYALGRAMGGGKKYKSEIRPFDRKLRMRQIGPKKQIRDGFLAAIPLLLRDVRNQTIYNTGMEEQENTKRFYRKNMQKNHLRNCTYTALISLFRHGKTRKYD